MIDGSWRERLAGAVGASGKSMRKVSLAAGMGPGYLHSILVEGKDPTIPNLSNICDQIGVSMTFILYGFEMSAANEQILRKLESMSPEKQEGLLKLIGDAPAP